MESLQPGAVVKMELMGMNWKIFLAYLKLQPNGKYIQVHPPLAPGEVTKEWELDEKDEVEPVNGDEYKHLLMGMFEE